MLVVGPPITLVEHVVKFRKKYKKVFVRDGKVCAKVKRKIKNIHDVLNFIRKGEELKDMGISKVRLAR
jgi:tRNA nucleotidyltransferase (CCA-adding enzyme)